MKLTQQDIKLLAYIYQGSREPITKIAKECKLSREQVNYKLKKFQDNGLIKKFVTIFNYPSLGYNVFSILLLKSNKEIKLTNTRGIIGYSNIIGTYDYYIILLSKNEQEMKKTIMQIVSENKEIVENYKIIKPYFTEMYPLKFIQNRLTFDILEKTEKQKLTEADKKILKILEKDARIKIIRLAGKLNISAELALYKLRNLQKKKVILGTKADFDIKILGFNYSMIALNLFNISNRIEEQVKKFAKENKLVNSLILSIEEPQIVIQLFHKKHEELTSAITKIKRLLGSNIKNIELMFPQQEKELNTLPMID